MVVGVLAVGRRLGSPTELKMAPEPFDKAQNRLENGAARPDPRDAAATARAVRSPVADRAASPRKPASGLIG